MFWGAQVSRRFYLGGHVSLLTVLFVVPVLAGVWLAWWSVKAVGLLFVALVGMVWWIAISIRAGTSQPWPIHLHRRPS